MMQTNKENNKSKRNINLITAFNCMYLLLIKGIDINIIMRLTDPKFCKENFKCRKPILKQVNRLLNIPREIKYDYTNQPRFYKEVFDYNGVYFLITNYWYGPHTKQPDNVTPFKNWVSSLTN